MHMVTDRSMKALSCTFLLLALLSASSTIVQALSFEDWSREYSKVYRSQTEKEERRRVFYQSVDLVDKLNVEYENRGVVYRVNQFADLTAEEFKYQILLPPSDVPASAFPSERYADTGLVGTSGLPDTFDWREKGVVSSVKDQGSVGSCWAFSTVGNVEGQWALAGNKLVSLSTEQLVDCDATYDPKNLHQDCGVCGGWPYLAYQYIMKTGGIESEANYPYCCGVGDCFPCVPDGYNKTRCGAPPPYCNKTQSCEAKLNSSDFVPNLKVKTWVAIEKNETKMMSELVSRGPLSVLIDASTLQFYHSGVWDPITCSTTDLDHAVLLVGYGTHKGLFKTQPYWLVKNSWGVKWGQDGYFMMLRGKGKCGVDQQVTSAVL